MADPQTQQASSLYDQPESGTRVQESQIVPTAHQTNIHILNEPAISNAIAQSTRAPATLRTTPALSTSPSPIRSPRPNLNHGTQHKKFITENKTTILCTVAGIAVGGYLMAGDSEAVKIARIMSEARSSSRERFSGLGSMGEWINGYWTVQGIVGTAGTLRPVVVPVLGWVLRHYFAF